MVEFLRGGSVKTWTERIRELREDSDMKQQDIANLLQTTQQVYSRYEKGINEIPVRHLILLARFYNVSLDYIVGETDNRKRYT
ncbi:MAG: helix-turn-helix transcriptional regulator [Clostridia bacterium]|nr:helix-turn-helix transcriptional regulator [Clostridia bacterium]